MLLAALIDLGAPADALSPLLRFRGCAVEEVTLRSEKVTVGAVGATRLHLGCREAAPRRGRDVPPLLEAAASCLGASAGAAERAWEALDLLLDAEASLQGTTAESLDLPDGAFLPVVKSLGFFHLLEQVGEAEALATPLATGSGTVVTTRGLVVVPSPVVVEIARRRAVPLQGGPAQGELTTATATAVLAVAARFVDHLPSFVPQAVGYGAGTKTLPTVPLLRATRVKGGSLEEDSLVEASIDDATGEEMSRFLEELQKLSLETHLVQALGKKGRPLFLIRVLARPDQVEAVKAYLLEETPTLGVRSWPVRKDQADRRFDVRTAVVDGKPYPLRVKISRIGDAVKEKPEDEDVRRLPLRR